MNCPACNKHVTPMTVGTGNFCPACGARFEATAARARVKSMDIVASRGPRQTASTRLQTPATPAQPAHQAAPKHHIDHSAAQAVHHRAATAPRTLDLRARTQPNSASNPTPTPATSAVTAKQANQIKLHDSPHLSKPTQNHAEPIQTNRLERAKAIPKSAKIAKFSPEPLAAAHNQPAPSHPAPSAGSTLPAHAATQHAALAEIAKRTPTEPIHGLQTSKRGRFAATVTAIAILAGYVWMVNYPKLAISSAGNRAGIAASMPKFLPSSYNLAATTTAPGIVTLQFASPNQTNPLTITQHKSDWDNGSLIDNYVSKVTSQYSSIEGQGLTVYVFDNNNASWVNHGIWYSIAGTAKLSREQILKIAYGL